MRAQPAASQMIAAVTGGGGDLLELLRMASPRFGTALRLA